MWKTLNGGNVKDRSRMLWSPEEYSYTNRRVTPITHRVCRASAAHRVVWSSSDLSSVPPLVFLHLVKTLREIFCTRGLGTKDWCPVHSENRSTALGKVSPFESISKLFSCPIDNFTNCDVPIVSYFQDTVARGIDHHVVNWFPRWKWYVALSTLFEKQGGLIYSFFATILAFRFRPLDTLRNIYSKDCR